MKEAKFLTEQMRLIMEKPKEERLSVDNALLCSQLVHLSFFSKMAEIKEFGLIMFKTLMSSLEFKIYQPNEQIFKYNEPYNSMFIIIEGSVAIYKPPNKQLCNQSTPGIIKKSFSYKRRPGLTYQLKETVEKVITEGEAYGDKDIKRLKKHPCLVEAKTKCIIGLLALTDYSLIFEKTQFLEKVTIHRLLSSIPFFSNLNQNVLNNLIMSIEKESYNKGEYVLTQGEALKKIYIVRKGLFRVSLKNTRRFFNSFDMSYFDKLKDNRERFSTYRTFELKDSYNQVVEYKLINYGPGEIIGDCEYKLKSNISYFTIQCDIDNSELLSIDMKKFSPYLTDKYLPIFNEKVNDKLSFLKRRLDEIRQCQKELFSQKNEYVGAILRKLPEERNKAQSSSLKSISHEKKFDKIVSVNNEELKRLKSYVKRKRIQYNSNLSIEYSDMNANDHISTYSTLFTKKKVNSIGRIAQKKMKKTYTPRMVNLYMTKDPNKSLEELFLAKSQADSLNEENKKSALMLRKDCYRIKEKMKECHKPNEFNNSYCLIKRVLLRNNSSKVRNNLNAIFNATKNDSF